MVYLFVPITFFLCYSGNSMLDTPKTGAMNNPLLWGGIGVVALLGLMTAVLVIRKNRRKF